MSNESKTDIVTRSTNWLSVVLAFASASGLVLALLGYGVALSVDSRFGIPHTFTFNSTLDLFSLGSWAIVELFQGTAWWTTWAFYKGVLVSSARVLWPALAVSAVFFALMGAWLSVSKRSSGRNNRGRKVRALKVFFKRKVRQTPWLLSGAAFLVSSTVMSLGVPLAAIAVAALTTVFCTLLAVLPAMGLTAGKSHIDKWVVQPESCRSAKTSAEAAGPTASCLSLTRPDGSVEKGRVVFATSTSLVLYDPVTGSVKRLGIEGSKVAVVDKLID